METKNRNRFMSHEEKRLPAKVNRDWNLNIIKI